MTHVRPPDLSPGRSYRLAYLLTIVIALGITWGTLKPPGPEPIIVTNTDKLLHALAFALLILPIALFDLRRALRLAPFCIAFGALIELIQPSFGRGAEWLDLAADAFGVGVGILLAWTLSGLAARFAPR